MANINVRRKCCDHGAQCQASRISNSSPIHGLMPEAIRLPGYSPGYVSYLSDAMSTRIIAGVTVPDTPLISDAIELAREHLDDWAYNHVMRSWLYGFAIADRLPHLVGRDRELHSVAAILHDLGWDRKGEFVSRDKCFEVDGARAALAWIEQGEMAGDWDDHRKQLLWDSIALHTYPQVAFHKEPEVMATIVGIMADFGGQGRTPQGTLTATEYRGVSQEFPRLGFKDGMTRKLCGLCRTKPQTTYEGFVADFGEEFVQGYTRKGNRFFDVFLHMEEGA